MARLINLSNEDVDKNVSLDGYEAKDAGGEKMGKIDSVIADAGSMKPRYLVVDSGGLFSHKKYAVPVGEASRIDDNDKTVMFKSLTKNTLKEGRYPEYDESWVDSNEDNSFSGQEQAIAGSYPTTRSSATTTTPMETARGSREPVMPAGNQAVDYNSDLYRPSKEGAQRLQLLEEHLTANKERYQAGNVTLGKRVIERQETMEVPVTEERVVIERRPASDATSGEIGQDKTIEVPVERERVNVSKETTATEEVDVRKEAVQRNERVQGTVRKEELVVEDQGNLVQGGNATTSGQRTTGTSGETAADRARRDAENAKRNTGNKLP